MSSPIICFGQQPCGFFPKRFLISKIQTAKKLQTEIGGKVVLFYHDSDHDYRETITVLKDETGKEERLNFLQENKIQKKYSPLYAKRIPKNWREQTARRLPRFIKDEKLIDLFASLKAENVADFCLEMYRGMGLLEGIEIVRSGNPSFREAAIDLEEIYFADVEHEGEIVRAEYNYGDIKLHRGGGQYIDLLEQEIQKSQKNPPRDKRMEWMQSVVHCTHYIYGPGEKSYLAFNNFPDITFMPRDDIQNSNEAFIEIL